MKIIEKFGNRSKKLHAERQPCIAFIGDSITQGCFELYQLTPVSLETEYDEKWSYPAYLQRALSEMFPRVTGVYVNAGVSGDNAAAALARLDRDVLSFRPDLVVVCFGLNDCASGENGLAVYSRSMESIVSRCKEAGAEVIVMTPNATADHLSPRIKNLHMPFVEGCAADAAEIARSGMLDRYVEEARAVARKCGVPLCDAYARWKKLGEYGADIAELLSNNINHPTRGMNAMFAAMLLDIMIDN